MLTPSFSLKQDDKFLTFLIQAPLAKVSDAEIYVEDNEFIFHSTPYYLRLNLPGSLVDDDRASAKYIADEGHFVVSVAKATHGEHFEGLDMLTKLLTSPKSTSVSRQPLIEVLDEASAADAVDPSLSFSDDNDDDQTDLLTQHFGYGFAEQRTGVFTSLQGELSEAVEIKNADSVPVRQRAELRFASEEQLFSEDHYLADLFENEDIDSLISFIPGWQKEDRLAASGQSPSDCIEVEFTQKEEHTLRSLPRKEYLIDKLQKKRVFLSLVDVMFAFAYNNRITEGENNVESGWTISRLSPTLSWLQRQSNVDETVRSSFRRCLTCPLHRHWLLAQTVFNDVATIFKLGRKRVLKCLLQIHHIFSHTYPYYVLNDLYITDYCVWIQHVREDDIQAVYERLLKVEITKSDVGFDLDILEVAARSVLEDQNGVDDLTKDINQLEIAEHVTSGHSCLSVNDRIVSPSSDISSSSDACSSDASSSDTSASSYASSSDISSSDAGSLEASSSEASSSDINSSDDECCDDNELQCETGGCVDVLAIVSSSEIQTDKL